VPSEISEEHEVPLCSCSLMDSRRSSVGKGGRTLRNRFIAIDVMNKPSLDMAAAKLAHDGQNSQ
jgi:hypothetical protein